MGLLHNVVSGVFLLLCSQKKPVKLGLSGILLIRNGPGPIKTGFSRFQCTYLYITTNLFFKCRCSEEDFNAKPAVPSHLCHSLIELLSQLSPAFKRNFATLQKKRTQRHPFERVATPYQVYAWASPQAEHTVDAIRAEDSKYLLIIFYYRV